MTREKSDHDKDNPATDPYRENGQGKHDGSSHKPEEFLEADPDRTIKPSTGAGRGNKI